MRNGSWSVANQAKRVWPFILVVLALFPLTYMAHLRMGTVATSRIDTSRQFFVVAHNVAWYAIRTCIPRELSPIYPKVSFVGGTILFIVVSYASAIFAGVYLYMRKRDVLTRYVVPLAACFLSSLVPVVGLIPFGFIDYADRYSYIPSFFIWLGLGMIIEGLFFYGDQREDEGRGGCVLQGLIAAAFACSICFSIIDHYYIRSWKSVFLLHKMALTHAPPNNKAVKFLADLELAKGNRREALRLADILACSREEWMTRKDIALNLLKADYINAVVAFQNGRTTLAFEVFRRIRDSYAKLADIPGNKRAVADHKTILVLLAACFDKAGRADEATDCYEELLSHLNFNDRDGMFYRGVVLMRKKEYSKAERLFNKALESYPGDDDLVRHSRFCAERSSTLNKSTSGSH
jgi:tetratricopeptide (TPR) repeat protein